jgi:hypothetical protein
MTHNTQLQVRVVFETALETGNESDRILRGLEALGCSYEGANRKCDGKPNLIAPAPRAPDGRPDLSGLWRMEPSARELTPRAAAHRCR